MVGHGRGGARVRSLCGAARGEESDLMRFKILSMPSPPSPGSGLPPRAEHGGTGSSASSGKPAAPGSRGGGRWVLLLVALVAAAPMIASYLAYYVFKPNVGSTNYGAL